MSWLIWVLFILVGGYFIFNFFLDQLIKSNNPKVLELIEAGRQIREEEREPGETLEEAKKRKHLVAQDKVVVPSYTENDVCYEIDTNNLTCTCPDWIKRRSIITKDYPARLCKHLVEYFSRRPVELPQGLKPYKDIIIFQGKRLRGMALEEDDSHVLYGIIEDIAFMADYIEDSEWINVVICGNRYGYNYRENRWSYSRAPKYAEKLIPKIQRLTFL